MKKLNSCLIQECEKKMSQEQNPIGNESLRRLLSIAFAFVDSMALKCAIELGIADIINAHGRPVTLSEIASHFNSCSLDLTGLSRLMRVLVRKEIFTALNPHPDETLYWLTPTSRLILKDTHLDDQSSYAPMVMFLQHPQVLTPWNHLSSAIKEGGVAFEKAHNGRSIWEFLAIDQEFNKVFQEGMASNAKNAFRSVALQYKDLFVDVKTVVDVGGGIGAAVIEIVKAHPHIKGINFDLAHVIAIAPEFPGVTHVEGDMFKDIPSADVVILKSILHDWSDEDCVKILKNCRRAIQEKNGKVIVFEQLAQQELERGMDDIVYASDLLMMVHTGVGKERTEYECKVLLENAGFLRHQLIKRPGLPAIIEGYLE